MATGRGASDPADVLSIVLTAPKAKHHAAILEPKKFGELLRAIDGFTGHPVTHLALKIAPHVFVRPGELRHAEWSEINLDEAVWRVPEGKMKARRPHAVPLSSQVVHFFKDLQELTGHAGFAFPALHTKLRPMSENTINAALRRMGFTKDEMTAHGFRAMAATLLNEMGTWNADAIERQLAHMETNSVRRAYARGEHWNERVKMMQH